MSLTAWRISMVKYKNKNKKQTKQKKNPQTQAGSGEISLSFKRWSCMAKETREAGIHGREHQRTPRVDTVHSAALLSTHGWGKATSKYLRKHCLESYRALSLAYCSAARAKDASFMGQWVAFPQEFSFRSRWGLVLNQVLCWPSHGLKTDSKECNCFQVTYPVGLVEGGRMLLEYL